MAFLRESAEHLDCSLRLLDLSSPRQDKQICYCMAASGQTGRTQREQGTAWRRTESGAFKMEVFFAEGHERQPGGIGRLLSGLYCQHYGKSLSVEHWEETCDYYIKHFPFETYGRKWLARKGQAIHTQSDFMRPLYEWGDALFANAVKI